MSDRGSSTSFWDRTEFIYDQPRKGIARPGLEADIQSGTHGFACKSCGIGKSCFEFAAAI
jgi:hypothetical protein